jgi:hypothetical protein
MHLSIPSTLCAADVSASDTRPSRLAEDAHPYVYVLVRLDIPLHQQLVQASHAAFEAGLRWHSPDDEVASLIVLEVRDKAALLRAARKLTAKGVDHHLFFEPDFDMGESALATRPLVGPARRPLSGYPLWNAGAKVLTREPIPAHLQTAEAGNA